MTLTNDGASMREKSLCGESGGKRVAGSGDSFAGSWHLDNGAMAVAAQDGTYTIGPLKGSWRSATGQNRFEIAWPLVDRIVISSDGTSLNGSNQFGAFAASKQKNCE